MVIIRSTAGSRATPLKSLLKKPSVDLSSDSESEVAIIVRNFL